MIDTVPGYARPLAAPALLALCNLLMLVPAQARLVRLQVEQREPLALSTGAAASARYIRLRGRFHGELDPALMQNRIINDISLAPRNAAGRVEYSATFTLLLPEDPARLSGVLIYEVPNRGNSPLFQRQFTDDMAAGHALLSSGWQGDLTPRANFETISVPVARNADGSPVTGPVLARLSNLPAGATTAPLSGGYTSLNYQRPLTLDTAAALLTRQSSDQTAVTPIASADWAFADCSVTPFPGQPDPGKICLRGGFQPDQLYQLTFKAKDPLVLGIGLAATRDLVSFLRYAERDDAGTPNPLGRGIRHSLSFGTSQSGNYIKTFIHLGFNQDETGRRVWDGVNPNIAARQNPLNFRFAIPGGSAGLFEPGSEGVLWWGSYRDTLRGRGTASLLDRCRATESCPKVMETFGSAEFWGLKMSPGLTGTLAAADIPLPPEVRRYYFPGVTHGGGAGGFSIDPRPSGACALPANPNSMNEVMRALRLALIDWVVEGKEPPESVYPRLERGELVLPVRSAMGFPAIPGAPVPDNLANLMPDYDFGPQFSYADVSGAITIQPPVIRRWLPVLVPRTDADGNEQSGIPLVLNQAPLGTYLGWNVTAAGYLKGRGCGFVGGFIPFARSRAERLATGDPRLSLEERYLSHERYVERVKDAVKALASRRLLLPDDAARVVAQAESSTVLR